MRHITQIQCIDQLVLRLIMPDKFFKCKEEERGVVGYDEDCRMIHLEKQTSYWGRYIEKYAVTVQQIFVSTT